MPIRWQLTNRSGEHPATEPKPALEVDSVIALCEAARQGIGAAAVPRPLVAEDIKAGRLVVLSPNWDLMPVGVYAVWPNNVAQGSLAIQFVRFMAARMTNK